MLLLTGWPKAAVCAALLVTLISAVPTPETGTVNGSGSLCVLAGDSRIEIPIPGGPRIQGTIDLPQGSSLQCSSCTAGRPHDLYTESHYLLLTDGHVLVFTYSCELYDSLDLNAQCIPKYIQRSSKLNIDRYFVICHDGPWYHQIDYDSNTGEYHLEFDFDWLPSGLSAAIVGGTNPNTGMQEDYHVRVVGNILFFTELSNNEHSTHSLGQSDDCFTPTAIDPMIADINGKRRVIVTCNNTDSDARRYEITADENDPKPIEPDGVPIPSPEGDYLLVLQQQGIKLYRTTEYSFAPHTYSADILDARFQQSRNKLFLSVAVAGEPLKLVDVEVFVTSGGSDGVEQDVNGTLCPEGHCLPHGLTGPASHLYFVLIQEQLSYTFLLYNLDDLMLLPQRVSTILTQPDLALVQILPSATPSSVVVVSTVVPQLSSSIQPSLPLSPSPSSTQVENPTPNPETGDTNDLPVWTIILLPISGVFIVMVVLIIAGIFIIKQCGGDLCTTLVKPIPETQPTTCNPEFVITLEPSHSTNMDNPPTPPSESDSGITTSNPTPDPTPVAARNEFAIKAALQLSSTSDEGNASNSDTELNTMSWCRSSDWTPEPPKQASS